MVGTLREKPKFPKSRIFNAQGPAPNSDEGEQLRGDISTVKETRTISCKVLKPPKQPGKCSYAAGASMSHACREGFSSLGCRV